MKEIIGYIGMALVIASFLFRKIKTVRFVNMCGGILSCIYGFLTLTYPTAFLNLSLVIINASFLITEVVKKKNITENPSDIN